jgi:O-antigen/teichoic acid export membrane protein
VSLAKDTLLYASATLIERALGFALLSILTRLLKVEEFGVWAQTAAVCSMLMPFAVLGIPASVVRFFSAGLGPVERARWMGLLLAPSIAIVLAFAAIGLLAPDLIAKAVYGDAKHLGYLGVLLTLLAADIVFDLLVAFQRASGRMRRIAAALVTRGSLRIGILGLGLTWAQLSFAQAFFALAVTQLALTLLVYAGEARSANATQAETAPSSATMSTLLGFAAPMLVTSVLASIHTYVDRLVLAHLAGIKAVAIYSAAGTLVSVVTIAHTVIGFTVFPLLSRVWTSQPREVAAQIHSQAMAVYLYLAAPLVAWLTVSTNVILPIVATQDYLLSKQTIALLCGAALTMGVYQVSAYWLLMLSRGKDMAYMTAVALVANVTGSVWLVPTYGITGAATSAFGVNLLLCIAALVRARSLGAARFPWRIGIRTCCMSLGLAMMMAAFISNLHPGFFAWLAASATLLAIYGAVKWHRPKLPSKIF